jgi:hypothetical protein
MHRIPPFCRGCGGRGPSPGAGLAEIAAGAAALLLQGTAMARASVTLGAELVRIVLGRSDVCPERGDWRFKDPT